MREPIDVVVPVYNAPQLVRRCIESLYRFSGPHLGEVFVHDNASGSETRDLLDSLCYPGLRIHHAAENTGFGSAVNNGVSHTRAELVLVLNSDVEARSDFLPPLIEALRQDARFAAVVPSGNTFRNYDLSRYASRGECVVSYNLRAYAFLLRRAAFEEVGSFDPVFGLGFFEDSDLSRKLLRAGWWLGVHPKAQLHHEIHGSFQQLPEFRRLVDRNRQIYLERYPEAARRVLLATGTTRLADATLRSVEQLLREGGKVHWLAPGRPDELMSLDLRWFRLRLLSAVYRVLRRQRRPHKRFTEIWIDRTTPGTARRTLAALARGLRITTVSIA